MRAACANACERRGSFNRDGKQQQPLDMVARKDRTAFWQKLSPPAKTFDSSVSFSLVKSRSFTMWRPAGFDRARGGAAIYCTVRNPKAEIAFCTRSRASQGSSYSCGAAATERRSFIAHQTTLGPRMLCRVAACCTLLQHVALRAQLVHRPPNHVGPFLARLVLRCAALANTLQ
jgi:hypothetical protein